MAGTWLARYAGVLCWIYFYVGELKAKSNQFRIDNLFLIGILI